MKPFVGCQVRIINKRSVRYGLKGGITRITDSGDYVVNIDGREHVFGNEDISMKMSLRKCKKRQKDKPCNFADQYGTKVDIGDVILYVGGKRYGIRAGIVDDIVFFNGKPALSVRTSDGSKVKWSIPEKMMRIDPKLLPVAARRELGIDELCQEDGDVSIDHKIEVTCAP